MTLLMVLGAGCARQSRPPDVVWIVVDTLRADHVGCYGSPRPTTPNIDRLAGQSVRFETAYSQAPWTTPSFASMLTSLYPTTLGVTEKPDRLDDRFTLLSEVLSVHGWDTGAVISHYFLKAKWNLCQGFDVYDESAIVGHGGVSGDIATGAALDFLDNHPDRPVFLFVHYFDPHYDYIEHPGYLDTSDIAYDGPITSGMVYTDLKEIVRDLDEEDLDYLRRLYDSEIAYTDARIGELLDGLRARGRFDDAVIVFTADHGEEFRERSTVGHGGTVYNELIHVPLIVKLPGSAQTGVLTTEVGLIDLYPTILDLVGVSIDHDIAGTSMLDGDGRLTPTPRPIFSETDWGFYRTVIDGHLKLIRRLEPDRLWFFDLAANPREIGAPIEPPDPDAAGPGARRLAGELDRWMADVERDRVGADAVEVSDEERTQLEALGYLD
ncbi:MAG: sulfatase [Holophagae bacterium]|jgi:arylsulfatase A-like enzyme